MALTKIKTQSINDNAITNAKMADDAIDSADLADGSIDNVHLAGSIAVSKTLLSAGTGLTLSTNTLSVDAAQTQITTVGTLTSFASTGIDDNATTNAITIDSSEQTIFTRAGASDDNKATVKIEPTGSYGMGLHVYSNADNDANALVQIHSDNASMNMPALRVIQDGTGDAAWLNGGNVSIGNNSPTTKLHITADSTEEDVILLEDNSGTDIGAIRIHGGAFVMKGKSSTAPIQLQTHDGNEDIEVDPDGFIKFETAGSERMRILSSGHIGFGTNDPFTAGWTGERAFEFKGDNTHINLRGNQSGTTAVYAGIWFNDDDNITIGDDPRGVGLRATHDGSADSAKFTILTRKTGTGGATEALTIDSNQNSTFAGDIKTTNHEVVHETGFGYDANSYKVIQFGGDKGGNKTISLGYDPSGNNNSGFAGSGDEILTRNTVTWKTPNDANNGWHVPLAWDDGNVTMYGKLGVGATPTYTIDAFADTTLAVLRIRNDHESHPQGFMLQFTDAAPDNNTQEAFKFSDTGNNRCIIWSDGDVNNSDNAYGSLSDARAKQGIRDANSQWDDIKAIKVRNFKKTEDVLQYGDKAWEQIGVVAQELEESGMDKLVREHPADEFEIANNEDINEGDMVKSVVYSIIYMKAIKALQEAMAKIETLESKVTALENA